MTDILHYTDAMRTIIHRAEGKRNKKLEVMENKCSAFIVRSGAKARKEFTRQIRTGERSMTYWTGVE